MLIRTVWYTKLMKIQRYIKSQILGRLKESHKIVILYGPRQSGKTTLCKEILAELGVKTLSINADEQRFSDIFASRDTRRIFPLVEGYDLLFIDEAQRIANIGISLKLLFDSLPTLKILVTGSSSFELANQISEPLTGRHWTYYLYPISYVELQATYNKHELHEILEERMIWGAYPEIFQYRGNDDREKYLRQLAGDYLYKDIFMLSGVRQPEKIRTLLKLLAFQIGSEVSLPELASQLSMSKETVSRYIDLLEQAFVLFRVGGFSKNLRKEVSKSNKYYFVDLGVRNSLIDNFNYFADRNDIGALWENFLISERRKRNAYRQIYAHGYFWRTYTGAEVDYIEDTGTVFSGYECKWGVRKTRVLQAWNAAYPDASWEVVNQENFLDFVL